MACCCATGWSTVWALPVAVVNDARAFTLGDARLGAGRGCDTLVSITLGTGVGGRVVIGGRLIPERGAWPRGSAQVARNRRDCVPTLRISGPNAVECRSQSGWHDHDLIHSLRDTPAFFASCYYLILSGSRQAADRAR